MAHVAYVEADEVPESIRPIFENVQQRLGLVPNFYRTMAHSPALLQACVTTFRALGESTLSPALRELAFLKTTELNGCGYCRQHHHRLARQAGLAERQVQDLDEFETSDSYDDRQRAVLRFAEQVTRHVQADPELIADLKTFLSDRELVELTTTVAFANFTNRINEALQVGLP